MATEYKFHGVARNIPGGRGYTDQYNGLELRIEVGVNRKLVGLRITDDEALDLARDLLILVRGRGHR